jgi:hypothetical protein
VRNESNRVTLLVLRIPRSAFRIYHGVAFTIHTNSHFATLEEPS